MLRGCVLVNDLLIDAEELGSETVYLRSIALFV